MDAAALQARLESLLSIPKARRSLQSLSPSVPSSTLATPPPLSEEEERKIYNQQEEESHKLLTEEGCPPCHPCDASCHPSNFSFHPRDERFSRQEYPEQYRKILAFFDTESLWGAGPLAMQSTDWCEFRDWQSRVRHCDMQRFTKFTEVLRERRRRCNLPEDVCPRFQLKEQTRQENWVEFQDYHLRRDEVLEMNVEIESKCLDAATKKLPVAAGSDLDRAEHDRFVYTQRLDFATKQLESHKKFLLPWIERERIKMATAQSTTAEETNGTQKTSNPSASNSVLNSVRSAISERDSGKRSLQSQQPELSARSAKPTSDFRTSHSNTTQLRNLSKKQTRKPRASRSQNFTEQYVTKRGRTSKRPQRPGFISC